MESGDIVLANTNLRSSASLQKEAELNFMI